MTALIEDLGKDHQRFRRYLVWFSEEIGVLASGGSPDYLLLNMLSTYFADYPDELHHKKEDILYWRVAEKARNKRVSLGNLQEQHIELSVRANRFADIVRSIINNEQLPIDHIVSEAVSYTEILTAHMSSEEDLLFRPARKLLSADDWWNVEQAIGDLLAEEINYEKGRSVLEIEQSLDRYLR